MLRFVTLWIIALYILMQNEFAEEGWKGSSGDMEYRAKWAFERFIFLVSNYKGDWR